MQLAHAFVVPKEINPLPVQFLPPHLTVLSKENAVTRTALDPIGGIYGGAATTE